MRCALRSTQRAMLAAALTTLAGCASLGGIASIPPVASAPAPAAPAITTLPPASDSPGAPVAAAAPAADPLGELLQKKASAPTQPAVTASSPPTPAAAPAAKDPLLELVQPVSPATPSTPNTTSTSSAPAAARDEIDVWERIRRGFAMPELETKLAADRTRWYAAQPDYFDRMAQRASLYLFHIVEEIEKRGMPTELALLPFVESAMQPEAVSTAKAAGLWQFIPSTGKIYSLEQTLWHDQRRDVIESTRAALDYLEKLHRDFNDWHLALAAYNWGEGAVGRAIARNRAQRKPTGYTSLHMPRETQHYVPKLQAIKNIVRDPARYGITLPAIRNEPYFVAVAKTRDIDVATAARLAEMPLDEFRALNPSFNRPVIVGAAQPNLLLPAGRAEIFQANLAAFESTGQPLASWTTYTLQKNETLAQVAQRADISEAKLREANRIPPRYRLASGSTILIPRDESMDNDIAAHHLTASLSLVPEGANLRQITYRVRRGDTLHSVARRWRVQPEEITAWNNLRSPKLFAGQRLTLSVVRTAAPAARARPGGSNPRNASRPAARPAAQPAARAAVKPASSRAEPRPAAPSTVRPAPSPSTAPNATRS